MHPALVLLDDLPPGLSVEQMLRAYDQQGVQLTQSAVRVPLEALDAPAPGPAPDPYEHLVNTSRGWRGLGGRVLVHVDREFNDEINCGGVLLKIDTSFSPLHHVAECGTVVTPPYTMREDQKPHELAGGEKIYFHYHSISAANLVVLDDRPFFLVEYEQCYCAIRPDGSVRMLNDFCLVSPVDESESTVRTASGIILAADERVRASASVGVVAHAAASTGFYPGQRIAFVRDADLPLTVEGVKYFVMDGQREIMATFPNFT